MIYYTVAFLLGIGDLLFWWWGDRRLRRLRRASTWRTLLGAMVGGQFILLVACVLFPAPLRSLGSAFWKPVSAWLYMWHMLVLPATLLCLFFGYLVLWLGGFLTKLVGPKSTKTDAITRNSAETSGLASGTGPVIVYPTRRQILASAAAFMPQAALGCAMLKSASQAGKFRVRRLEVKLPQLPPGLNGMTIAHVSDTHVGRFVGPRELEAVVAVTQGLKPDLIAFTGDLIDFNLADLDPALAAMRQLARIAPLATCVGNHDLFEDPRSFRRRLRDADVGLLVDEVMPVEVRGHKIDLLGLDWGTPETQRADGISEHMRNLLQRPRSAAFPILLAHHPHAFDLAAAGGIPLTLSGHTHGGQIMLTKTIGAGRIYKYWSGLYEKGPAKLVVSNGVGNWFPLRINAPAEIVYLTLRSA
jgi:predicted MPP superfamily phosphohydrolase